MKQLENFIDSKFDYFSELSDSEVETFCLDEFDIDIIDYLKLTERFDYKGICVYYVKRTDEIWIENFRMYDFS